MAKQLPLLWSTKSEEIVLLPSSETYSLMLSENRNPFLESRRKGLIGKLSLRSLSTSVKKEEKGGDQNKKDSTQKDEIISQLTILLAQRNAVISQLEDLVLIQKSLLEERISGRAEKNDKEGCCTHSQEKNFTDIMKDYQQKMMERKHKRDYYKQRRIERLSKLQSLLSHVK